MTEASEMDSNTRSGPDRRLDPMALAASASTVAAAVMLVLGLFGRIGVYTGAVGMRERWHLFFRPTLLGTIAGMVEAAVVTFPVAWLVAWLYNVFTRR
ncbi:MAG: hypothetical protein RLN75_04180 [Longimicrobiales bacterium]